jgi:hypothetical protein
MNFESNLCELLVALSRADQFEQALKPKQTFDDIVEKAKLMLPQIPNEKAWSDQGRINMPEMMRLLRQAKTLRTELGANFQDTIMNKKAFVTLNWALQRRKRLLHRRKRKGRCRRQNRSTGDFLCQRPSLYAWLGENLLFFLTV